MSKNSADLETTAKEITEYYLHLFRYIPQFTISVFTFDNVNSLQKIKNILVNKLNQSLETDSISLVLCQYCDLLLKVIIILVYVINFDLNDDFCNDLFYFKRVQ